MASVAIALAIAGLATTMLVGDHGVAHWLRLRAERRELGQIAFGLIQRNEQLREDVRRLREDDRTLEALARRQLGLVRPNERVYRLRRD